MRNVFFRGSNLFTCFISMLALSHLRIVWAEVLSILAFCGFNVIVQEIQLDNQAGF